MQIPFIKYNLLLLSSRLIKRKCIKFFIIWFLFSLNLNFVKADVINKNLVIEDSSSFFGEISPPCINHSNLYFQKSLFDNLSNLKINVTLNYRKLIKRMIQKRISINDGLNIGYNDADRLWNKYQPIKIKIGNTNCVLEGEFKLTGDGDDHYASYKAPNSLSDKNFHSIKIKLKKGSIDNIENFKLFVPHSRGGEKEIITTLLFNKLGFLSPRSALINIEVNGIKRKMIFQEDIDKNFLEYNNVSESLIFEGFENTGLGLPFSALRISNVNFIKDIRMSRLAIEKHSFLTQVYLNTGYLDPRVNDALNEKIFFIDPIINPIFFDDKSRKEMTLFSILSFATISTHGLSKDDSRLVYDNFSQTFRPIYYDGNTKIGEYNFVDTWGSLLDTTVVPFEFLKSHKDELLSRIKNINIKKFNSDLKKLGVSLTQKEVEKIFNSVITNLVNINPIKNLHEKVYAEDIYSFSMENWDSINKQYQNLKNTKNSEFIISKKNLKASKCISENKFKDCKKIKFKDDGLKVIKSLLSQELSAINLDTQKDVYLGYRMTENDNKSFNFKNIKFEKISGVNFFASPNIDISLNNKKREIIIFSKEHYKKSSEKQVLIQGGSISNWNIKVLSENILGYESSINSNLSNSNFTGCLTFSDIKLKNVSIKMMRSSCEDSVHFVRVLGKKLKLEIEGSYSDAVDSDFSDIHFDTIKIKSAGNDCIDFSGGKYIIEFADLKNCGDKGVSVGEKSNVKVKQISINNSKTGLVSKDSSILNVGQFEIKNSKYCMASYRKKNEFLGGVINLGKGTCHLKMDNQLTDYYIQEGSLINLKN